MALSQEEKDARIARVVALAQRHPRVYRLRLLLVVLLGYGAVGALLIALLALLGSAIAAAVATVSAARISFVVPVVLGLAVLSLIGRVVRALWMKRPVPQGITLERRDAPGLFDRVDALLRQLEAARCPPLMITGGWSAAVQFTPRLGLFGWDRIYLMLSLATLKAMTKAQFDALLAHELYHLVDGYQRARAMDRLSVFWAWLRHELSTARHWSSLAVVPFVDWYGPYLAAYRFALGRMQEYEADAAAARLTAPRIVAEMLSICEVIPRYLEEKFWPDIHRLANTSAEPPFAPYAHFGKNLDSAIPEDAIAWLDRALAEPTTLANYYPSLADRLAALGEPARLLFPGEGEAADRLLGASLDAVTDELDRQWLAAVEPEWAKRFATGQECRERLVVFNAKLAAGEELPIRDALEQIGLEEEFGTGAELSLERLGALHARAPDHGLVCLLLGGRLLNSDSSVAIGLIERAMELDEEAIEPGSQCLRDFYASQGNREQSDRWQVRLDQHTREAQAAGEERDRVSPRDVLEPHGLDEVSVAALRESLSSIEGVRKAWLTRRRCRHLPKRPSFVLGFSCYARFTLVRIPRVLRLHGRIIEEVKLPDPTLVVCTDAYGRYRRMQERVADSLVFVASRVRSSRGSHRPASLSEPREAR